MADIFREVDEDLRHERYLKLWRRGGATGCWAWAWVALGGAVAYVMLTDAQESARQAEGRQFCGCDGGDRGRPRLPGRGKARDARG